MTKPLAGIRVADFSHVIAGPLATHFLTLLGAEVIKVEPPGGDVLRNYTQNPERRGMSEPFISTNAGKKSMVLDLKSPDGKEAAQRLIARSDILVENFRPGVIDRLGLGYAEVRRDNPHLIYCSVSGYGQGGPMRDYPAIDQIIQSVSGLMSLSGKPDADPMRIGFPIVDTYSALLAAFAIQSAFIQRERDPDKQGQYIDMSMLDASLVMMSSVMAPLLISGQQPVRTGNRGFSRAPTADTFMAADEPVTIGAVQQNQVERLYHAMGLAELLQDDRFATPEARMGHEDALQEILQATFQTRTAADWESILSEAGVPAGAVRSVNEVLALPQLRNRGLFQSIPVSEGPDSQATILNAGFLFGHDGPGVEGPAPKLGEHTEEILHELGLS